MSQSESRLAKYFVAATVAIAIKVYDEIHTGQSKISVSDGYFSFTRHSVNFPLHFQIRLPDIEEITSHLKGGQ